MKPEIQRKLVDCLRQFVKEGTHTVTANMVADRM